MAEKIVLLDRATIGPNIKIRIPNFTHEWVEHNYTEADELHKKLAGASIAITNKVPLPGHILDNLPQLKLIAIAATGFNHIDLEACKKLNITVSNITNYANHTVPEHVMAVLLMAFRQIKQYEQDIRAGKWQEADQFCFFSSPVHDLYGKRLGVIGRGELGRATGKLASCFGMEVVFAGRKGDENPPEPYLPFKEVLETSDALTLHLPLLPDTQNLIDEAEFALMKKQPMIINTARGGIVNEPALIIALERGQIRGAAMDVVTSEPPAPDHPFMKLINQPNFILTPHSAWASEEAMQTLTDQLIDNIEAFIAGSPRNVIS